MRRKSMIATMTAAMLSLSACGIDDDYLRARGFSVDGDHIYVDRGNEDISNGGDSSYEYDGVPGGESSDYEDDLTEEYLPADTDTEWTTEQSGSSDDENDVTTEAVTERATESVTEQATESTTEAVTYRADLVTDDPDMTMTITSYNSTRTFRVPHINYESTQCDKVNEEAKEFFDKGMAETQYVYNDDGSLRDMNCGYRDIDYDWYLMGDILSIEVQAHSSEMAHTDYIVYYIDLLNDRLVDASAVFDYTGVSDGEYHDLTRAELKNWLIQNGYIDEDDNYLIDDQNVGRAVTTTLSDENIDECLPYVGQDGGLHIIAKCYGIAGPDFVIRTFKLK